MAPDTAPKGAELLDAAECAANVLLLLQPEAQALGCGAARVLPMVREAVDNARMAQTTKERQEALRARRAMLGQSEVRGIYLPEELHKPLKDLAAKLAKRHERQLTKKPPPESQTS